MISRSGWKVLDDLRREQSPDALIREPLEIRHRVRVLGGEAARTTRLDHVGIQIDASRR